jgi:hypothetical protein
MMKTMFGRAIRFAAPAWVWSVVELAKSSSSSGGDMLGILVARPPPCVQPPPPAGAADVDATRLAWPWDWRRRTIATRAPNESIRLQCPGE